MKRIIIAISVLISIALITCTEKKNKEAGIKSKQTESTEQNAVKQTIEDEILTSSVTNKEGVKLDMSFNNTKKTATFRFNGETIEMNQDSMGSGIRYSNEKYKFSEWHGQIELIKDGKTVFKNIDTGKDLTK